MRSITLRTRVFCGAVEFLPGSVFTEEDAGSPEIFQHVVKAQAILDEVQPTLPSDIDSSKPGNLQSDIGAEAARVKAEQDALAAAEIAKSKQVAATAPETVPETRTNFDPKILSDMTIEDLNLLVVADGVTQPFETKEEAITFLSHTFTPKV